MGQKEKRWLRRRREKKERKKERRRRKNNISASTFFFLPPTSLSSFPPPSFCSDAPWKANSFPWLPPAEHLVKYPTQLIQDRLGNNFLLSIRKYPSHFSDRVTFIWFILGECRPLLDIAEKVSELEEEEADYTTNQATDRPSVPSHPPKERGGGGGGEARPRTKGERRRRERGEGGRLTATIRAWRRGEREREEEGKWAEEGKEEANNKATFPTLPPRVAPIAAQILHRSFPTSLFLPTAAAVQQQQQKGRTPEMPFMPIHCASEEAIKGMERRAEDR